MSTRERAVTEDLPPMISVEQALEFMLARARRVTGTETVPLTEALGRVLAHGETSPIHVPGYANSSMDGYAVRSVEAATERTA